MKGFSARLWRVEQKELFMGEATVDLPNPTEKPPLGAAPSTDELLSRLAGDEIDRLLAEAELGEGASEGGGDAEGATDPAADALAEAAMAAADAETESAANAPEGLKAPKAEVSSVTAQTKTASPADPDIHKQIDALFEELKSAEIPPPVARPPRVQSGVPNREVAQAPFSDTDGQVARQLDELFRELNESQELADPSLAAAPSGPVANATAEPVIASAPSTPSPLPAATAAQPLAATSAGIGADPALQTTSLERQVLSKELLDAVGKELTDEPGASETPAKPVKQMAPREPFYLRLLEMINAPFTSVSDDMRETIGTVAVITLMNAVAILVYVIFFR
jgi:hypothetical protein